MTKADDLSIFVLVMLLVYGYCVWALIVSILAGITGALDFSNSSAIVAIGVCSATLPMAAQD